MPPRFTSEIEAGFIHQAGRLHPDPLSPIQTDPSREEDGATRGIRPPLTFMQRVSFWIGRQKPATVRAIEDDMAGGLADDSPACLLEILCDGKIGWKAKMLDRKSTRLNSSHVALSRMPSSV